MPGYEISESGIIRNKSTLRIRKNHLHHSGYYNICYRTKNSVKYYIVSRLVAMAFIPNPDNKREVNHKNGIKTDDRACNLEWATPKENCQHRSKILDRNGRRPVARISDIEIRTYRSIAEAALDNKVSAGNITKYCKGYGRLLNGYKWQYA